MNEKETVLPKPDIEKGILKHGYRKFEYTDYFYEWNIQNSKYFPTMHTLAKAWGLHSGETIQKYCKLKNIELQFAAKPHYQDKSWCIDQFINKHKTVVQVANETGYKPRVLQKWVQEIHRLNVQKEHKKIHPTKRQYSLIYGGILGDGCIDSSGVYIVGHCASQKEYLEWQYNELRDLCTHNRKITCRKTQKENGKPANSFHVQDFYQFSTRRLDELKKIRLSKKQIDLAITNLDPLGLSIYFLDDGYCSEKGFWELNCGDLTFEQCLCLNEKIRELIGIGGKISSFVQGLGHKRYYRMKFNRKSSNKISQMIKDFIPNNLDIVREKLRYYNSL